MAVYLLHISPPVGHSRHYVGYARDDQLEERLRRHAAGTGGRLLEEARLRGSSITVVHVWPGAGREFEKRVKRHGGATRWCPACGINTRRMPVWKVE